MIHFSALLILLFALCITMFAKVRIASCQSEENPSVTITLSPTTTITGNSTPENIRFQLDYNISTYYFNPNDGKTNLTIPEGAIGWVFGNSSIFDTEIVDNLKNPLSPPIVVDGKISNPSLTDIIVPSHYQYRISLLFSSNYGVLYDEQKLVYEVVASGLATPDTLCIRLPSNYTIVEYSSNATREDDSEFINLKWLQSSPFTVFASFVPFQVQATIRSLTLSGDIPSVDPEASIQSTYEESFTVPTSFSVWPISKFFATVVIPIPEYSQVLNISRVWDGIGTCSRLSEMPTTIDNDTLGRFYVDITNGQITLYPRPQYSGNFYEYDVGATLIISPTNESLGLKTAKELGWPFQYESDCGIDKVIELASWKINVTGQLQISFTVPLGAQIITAQSGDQNGNTPKIEYDDRQTAVFEYQSPEELSPNKWHVTYEIIGQRNLFWLEISILAIYGILIFLTILLSPRIVPHFQIIFGVVGSAPVALIIFDVQNYMQIGWSPLILSVLFWIGIGLFLLWVFSFSWKYFKNVSLAKASLCPNCGHILEYLKTRLTNNFLRKEYKCPTCGIVFNRKFPWAMEKQSDCKSCGRTMKKITRIQTGNFRNETQKGIDVEAKCPNCNTLVWVRIRILADKH